MDIKELETAWRSSMRFQALTFEEFVEFKKNELAMEQARKIIRVFPGSKVVGYKSLKRKRKPKQLSLF